MSALFRGDLTNTVNLSTSVNAPYNLTVNFTWVAWIYILAYDGGTTQAIMGNADGGFTGGVGLSVINASSNAAAQPNFACFINGAYQNATAATGNFTSGTWTHLAGTYDGVNVKLWVNGVNKASNAQTLNTTYAGTANLSIGNIGPGGQHDGLHGYGQDAAIYNVVLTSAELLALANGARPTTIRPKSLVGCWLLDDQVLPAPDSSGSNNSVSLNLGTITAVAFAPPVMMSTPRSKPLLKATAIPGPSFNPAWASGQRFINQGIGI